MALAVDLDTVRWHTRGTMGSKSKTNLWALFSALLILTPPVLCAPSRGEHHEVDTFNGDGTETVARTPSWVGEHAVIDSVQRNDDLDDQRENAGAARGTDELPSTSSSPSSSSSLSLPPSSALSASPLPMSTLCDAGAKPSYRCEYGHAGEPRDSGNACAVGDDKRAAYEEEQEQVVVVESINKQVLEMLEDRPEVERVNFASASDGAKVLASNMGAKRVGALLDDDSDTFMRNDCKDDDKWVVIELSQLAKVSLIELSQYELYSSRVNEFAVYGMHSHPRKLSGANTNGWHLLGKFQAGKIKGKQSFSIEEGEGVEPERWVRYLLIRFLSHHGGESVCAINEIGVFGVSAAEELEAQLAMTDDESLVDGIERSVGHDLGEQNDIIGGNTGHLGGSENYGTETTDGEGVNATAGHGQVGEDARRMGMRDTSVVPVESGDDLDVKRSANRSGTASGARPLAGSDAQRTTRGAHEIQTVDEPLEGGDVSGEKHKKDSSGPSTDVHAKSVGPDAPERQEGKSTGQAATGPTAKGSPSSTGAAPSRSEVPTPPSPSSPETPSPVASATPSLADVQIPSQPKKGSNVYETLVQELRGTKAQQKAISKSFDTLAKNFEALSEELSAITANAGLYDSVKVQERIATLEGRLIQVGKVATAHSNAAMGMLAALIGSTTLQYLESMEDANPDVKKIRILPKAVRALVLMNVFAAAGLILKYINV